MLRNATRAGCPRWRLSARLPSALQRLASTRSMRQNSKPSQQSVLPTNNAYPAILACLQWHRMKQAKTYSPRRANPTPSSTPAPALETADIIFKARKTPLLASGVVALGLGIYISLLVSSLCSSPCCQGSESGPDTVPKGRPSNVFTKESARKFDQSLDGSEWLMGITALRRKLAAEASGHVLEVAIGTGRNLSYYDWSTILQPESPSASSTGLQHTTAAKAVDRSVNVAAAPILSYTGVDISGEMLGVAIDKLAQMVPQLAGVESQAQQQSLPAQSHWGVYSYLSNKLRVFQSDIHVFIPPPPEQISTSTKYDFVCSTFSLCSVRDPKQVIRDLANMVKPDTGRIILVEHGRGWWGFVNGLLDRSAASHFKKYGCWWNRDIAHIIESAAESLPELEVVKLDRPYITQLGTTLWVELRVSHTS
ncbi:methyltransferase OMS1 [Colletotrichum higginsianum]|uniref:Methyltransferase OMS1 n=1 Tax=Colletotrichum higginsianum (strain IMI 349063) TaxID=759273 RepID=H1VCC9_COLHI|nr:Methyltransferase OMS1 [Colletotrichum higginsianum IMI 349063]OBR10680.1 Methyltransferase OMS1 [Colletotrichum higginsianum IMI 349063]CCF37882.1 methyltransferase OMS1 [Colletotrichum higginsianum]